MLWASSDLDFIDLPPEQPFPFYNKTDKLRLYYKVDENFWAWLRECYNTAVQANKIVSPADLDKIRVVQSYVAVNFPGPGVPVRPEADSAETRERMMRFVDGDQKFMKSRDFMMWRPWPGVPMPEVMKKM